MFVHVCRTGQADIRTISVSHWGSELGLTVLSGLSRLYTSLVWESTVLLALCSEDTLPTDCLFGRQDMERLVPGQEVAPSSPASHGSSGEVTSAMEQLTTETLDAMEPGSEPLPGLDTEGTSGEKSKPTNPLLQSQIKQIKPLLSGSSRLGRALAELFGLLVKLCVGSPLRQRRGQVNPPTPAMPSPPARAVATSLTKLLTAGLSWQPPPTSPIPKFRLTFFICSVGFTSPMLFDEKKFPYHLMLMKFLSSGGQQAFFQTFHWAITQGSTVVPEQGVEASELPDGTGEFLDAWLMLLEKMVNPKTVTDSPHVLPSKASGNFKPFDSLRYLIRTHKLAFEAVMMLWGKTPLPVYGGRMAESVLTILCHILKGEKMIQERLEKEKPAAPAPKEGEGSSGSASTTPPVAAAAEPNWAASTPAEPDVNPEHLQSLLDMGFPRERCVEAMQAVGGSLDAATDYLLNNPLPPLQQSLGGGVGEQDDLMRAIAMSLGENVIVSTDGEAGPATAPGEGAPAPKEEEEEEQGTSEQQEELKQQVIDTFTDRALSGCLTLLDTLPETVYRVTDLLMAIFARNGMEFKEKLLTQLMGEVASSVEALLKVADQSQEGEESARAAVRIHLFTLLFEDCSRLCVRLVESSGAVDLMVRLVATAQEVLQARGAGLETPKWITPMLLFIDLYEKVVLAMRRREAMSRICSTNWKWFDVGAGKWQGYQAANNKTINDAFWAGEQSVKFTTGRRKYNIQFGSMMQANEETGNRRPLMIVLKRDEKEVVDVERKGRWKKEDSKEMPKEPEEAGKETAEVEKEGDEATSVAAEETMETSSPVPYSCTGLTPDQASTLLRAAVGLIAIPVEPDALNAILRMCLRLTRQFNQATLFAELGGIRLLLGLTQLSAFSGFSSLASLLVRHVLEDEATLRHTMEKIIRSSAGASTAATTKELHYLLRSLAPAACRQPETFTAAARDILRVDLALLSKRGEPEEDNRLLVKSLPGKTSATAPPLTDVSKAVISDLLDFLVQQADPDVLSEEGSKEKETEELKSATEEVSELPTSVATILAQGKRQGSEDKEKEAGAKEVEESRRKRPLLPKSAVCRLLAEMVKSYAGCARLITEHCYQAGISELVREDCTALAFILDELLTSSSDKESASLVRMLVAALASCNHAPEAQTSLVTEVKAALSRALSLPECSTKHTKVQALAGLVSTMIESCPAAVQAAQQPFKAGQVNMNNIVKVMLKRGVITDLARVSHALDLSSPSMAATINAALKPLETLTRIVNQPSGLLPPVPKTAKPKVEEPRSAAASSQAGGLEATTETTESATNAQGDELGGGEDQDREDATEHDVSATTESLGDVGNESALHTVEEGDPEDFDDMMEQLLEGERGGDALLDVVAGIGDLTSGSMDQDETVNDSQMMSQDDSQFVEEVDETRGGGEDDSDSDSSHSQETEGSGGEEEEMEENEDEEEGEDEEDEDDDDDAGSDVYDDEPDEFQDLEDAFFRMPGAGGVGTTERDHDNVMMIGHVNDDPLLEDRAISLPLWGDLATGEGAAAGEGAGGAGAGAAGVAPSHPLLMGRTGGEGAGVAARAGARSLTRQRGFRYIQLNPRAGGTQPGTPAILQSLLGHNSGREFLQLTTGGLGGAGREGRDATRVLVMDQGFAILDSLEDEIPGLESGILGQGGGSALATVPNALVRWTEESRVLDGDSLHDCMTGCKPDILEVVEKAREEELTERREKKRKQQEEDDEKQKKEEEERKKNEPEASTTPAAESAGQSAGEGDEMDVVVSENAAVEGLLEAESRREEQEAAGGRREESLQDTAHRLAEDLAAAISSRVTTMVGEEGAGAAASAASSGLLSSLQDLLPGAGATPALQASTSGPPSSTPSPPASLSSVLHSLQSSYQAGGDPSFTFATPPPAPFPPVPVEPATAPLPDALGPLSPSPDQEQQEVEQELQPMATEQEEQEMPPPPAPGLEEPTPPTAAPAETPSGSRQPDFSAILGDLNIPEGVDPRCTTSAISASSTTSSEFLLPLFPLFSPASLPHNFTTTPSVSWQPYPKT